MTICPWGRHTRVNSAATRSGRGANRHDDSNAAIFDQSSRVRNFRAALGLASFTQGHSLGYPAHHPVFWSDHLPPRTFRALGDSIFTHADFAKALQAQTKRFLPFHIMVKGNCWIQVIGAPPTFLSEGDIIIFLKTLPKQIHVRAFAEPTAPLLETGVRFITQPRASERGTCVR